MNEIKRLLKWVFGLALTSLPALAATMDTNDWAFLDNEQIRIGVKKTSGACIGWFSKSGSNRNLLNHHDQGRNAVEQAAVALESRAGRRLEGQSGKAGDLPAGNKFHLRPQRGTALVGVRGSA
jgi:hypothetical protein